MAWNRDIFTFCFYLPALRESQFAQEETFYITVSIEHIHGVHCAGLSDFSVRGAALRHFPRKVEQLFRIKFQR
jgi:hypothetical protein